MKDEISPAIASGPIEVVIVGDVTVEKATELVAATFGALPQRAAPTPADPAKRQVAFPAGVATPVQRTHKGRADQAIGYLAWPTTGFFANPQKARDTAVMGEVLELRLIDELRETQGATYSPQVSYNHSMVWPTWGYVSANVEIPPEKLPAFFADVRKIAADMRTKDISPDELERAKKPRIDQFEKARETNGYWLNELSGAQADPRRLDATRAILPGTERVTIADVRRAAQDVLVDDRMWMLEVKPGSNSTAHPGEGRHPGHRAPGHRMARSVSHRIPSLAIWAPAFAGVSGGWAHNLNLTGSNPVPAPKIIFGHTPKRRRGPHRREPLRNLKPTDRP
uniref:Insulinase family protein n=1 Tax=Phenylobacterium glaciei TaxID=2803784 RepID=A0A974P5L1_9CAUL|nr:insulinase family protein [Phenylobacterium glaciei]